MSSNTPTSESRPLFTGLPSSIVPYVAIAAALVSTYVHLSLVPVVRQFDTLQAVLFVLAGVGFLVGIAVYLSRYWRREFYLIGAAFALAQFVAFLVMGGPLNQLAIASKAAEVTFAVAACYLYVADDDAPSLRG